MAVESKLSRLVNGVQRHIDLKTAGNGLLLDLLQIKGGSGSDTEYFTYDANTLTAARTHSVPDHDVNLGAVPQLWVAGRIYLPGSIVVDDNDNNRLYITTLGGTAAGANRAADTGVTDWVEVSPGVTPAMQYKGVLGAALDLTAFAGNREAGWVYYVDNAGTLTTASGTNLEVAVGDMIIIEADGTWATIADGDIAKIENTVLNDLLVGYAANTAFSALAATDDVLEAFEKLDYNKIDSNVLGTDAEIPAGQGSRIHNIVAISQANYDAIGAGNYNDETLYHITDADDVDTFIELTDTPAAYDSAAATSDAGKSVVVNAAADGVEFSRNIIPDWAAGVNYAIGDYIEQDNKIYRATAASTPSSAAFATDIANWQEIGGGAKDNEIEVSLGAATTFAIGDCVYFDGTNWALADASDGAKLVSHVVKQLTTYLGGDGFIATSLGKVEGVTAITIAGGDVGEYFFLSNVPADAGESITTAPTTAGHYVCPTFQALSVNDVWVDIQRANVVAAAAVLNDLDDVTDTGIKVAGNDGKQYVFQYDHNGGTNSHYDLTEAAASDAVVQEGVANVAIALGEVVRFGQAGFTPAETAGQLYKADKDVDTVNSDDYFYAVGVAKAAIAAAATGEYVSHGLVTNAGWALTVGVPYYLGDDGALTATPPSGVDEAVVRIGHAKSATELIVDIQVMGVN